MCLGQNKLLDTVLVGSVWLNSAFGRTASDRRTAKSLDDSIRSSRLFWIALNRAMCK